MKTAVVLLGLVAMVASQVQVADNNPDLVQVAEYNADLVHVADNNPSQVNVVDNSNPSHVHVVDNNAYPVHRDDDFHYNSNNFVLDPAFGRPDAQVVDPAFGRPSVNVVDPAFYRPGVNDPAFERPIVSGDPAFYRPAVIDGSELINKEPAIIYPPGSRPQYPKLYDHPAWRGGK